MILCLEGPSAVGKSTTALSLAEEIGGAVIPEANKLYERPISVEPNWYLQRQVERWAMASKYWAQGKIPILDGDPFQPLWYNWVYAKEGTWQSLDFLSSFYEPLVTAGTIRFPDRYFVLDVELETLSIRKVNDSNNKRSRFLKHLDFIEPQKRYFSEMNRLSPGRAHFVSNSSSTPNLAKRISSSIAKTEVVEQNDIYLFCGLMDWLRRNPI